MLDVAQDAGQEVGAGRSTGRWILHRTLDGAAQNAGQEVGAGQDAGRYTARWTLHRILDTAQDCTASEKMDRT